MWCPCKELYLSPIRPRSLEELSARAKSLGCCDVVLYKAATAMGDCHSGNRAPDEMEIHELQFRSTLASPAMIAGDDR
jgi:hypothetical protein